MRINRLIAAPMLLLSVALLASGCSSGTPAGTKPGGGSFNSGNATYDAIINGGAVADQATIDANQWAKAIKAAGVLKVGGTKTSNLFSMLNPTTNVVTGFDAGLSQLLARYIIGDAKTELTQVTVDTRETLASQHQVDLVIATYSITATRMQQINFAGPYYQSQAAVLVQAGNTTIKSVDDLAGKQVATQANSTGVTLLQQYAPAATIVPLPDHAQCLTALQQGRVDAYVIDQTLLMNALVSNKDVKIVGDPFGPVDAYGIGVAKDKDAKAFIDAWLTKIEADGTWLNLWKATIGAMTGETNAPTPPAINSANNG